MTDRETMTATILAAYAARVRGDLKETMAGFDRDATFSLYAPGVKIAGFGEPSIGFAAIEMTLRSLIDNYRMENWRKEALIIENENAFLRWSADVTCTPTGKKAHFEIFDHLKFRDGKIVELSQSTCTAQILAISS